MPADFIPAQGFPPWEYISDELEARGWTREELAVRMCEVLDEHAATVNLCVLDFMEHLPYYPGMTMGRRTAEGLARAFGQDPQTWLNLHAAYYRWCDAHPDDPTVAEVMEHIRNRPASPPRE